MYMRSAGLRSHHNTIARLLIRLKSPLGIMKQAGKHNVLTWEIGRPVARTLVWTTVRIGWQRFVGDGMHKLNRMPAQRCYAGAILRPPEL